MRLYYYYTNIYIYIFFYLFVWFSSSGTPNYAGFSFSAIVFIWRLILLIRCYFHFALLIFLSPVLHASSCVLSNVTFLCFHVDLVSVMDSSSSLTSFLSSAKSYFISLCIFIEVLYLSYEFWFYRGYCLISFWNLWQ